MAKFVFGVKIYLDDAASPVTPSSTYGLYNRASTNSEYRWIENSITTTDTWKTGFLLDIGNIVQSADFRRGGNITEHRGLTVKVDNTSQFSDFLFDNSYSLNGLYCEIIRFDASGSPASETIRYRGICEAVTDWNEKEVNIPIKSALYKRQANLSTLIDASTNGNYPYAPNENIGSAIPVTFGQLGKAVFQCIAEKEIEFINSDYYDVYPTSQKIFPMDPLASQPTLSFRIYLGITVTAPISAEFDFTNKFIQVIEGENDGEFREINTAVRTANYVDITISDYFSDNFVASATFVKIVDIQREYQSDIWPQRAYLDENNNEITQNLTVFQYGSDPKTPVSGQVTVASLDTATPIDGDIVPLDESILDYVRLPHLQFLDISSGSYNKIEVDVSMYSGGSNRTKSYLILPVTGLQLNAEHGTSFTNNWGFPNATYVSPGLYQLSRLSGGDPYPSMALVLGALSNVTDRKHDTLVQYNIAIPAGQALSAVGSMTFTLPNFPEGYDFENLYMGIRCETGPYIQGASQGIYKMQWRRFLGASTTVKTATHQSTIIPMIWEDFPDFYFEPPSSTNNLAFYVTREGVTINGALRYGGYLTFPIDNINTKDLYESLYLFNLTLRFNADGDTGKFQVTELAFIFEKTVSIKNKIYLPVRGRIFNTAFGAITYGDATTEVSILNAGWSFTAYVWTGTGTEPNFSTMAIGSTVTINSPNFNAANNGTFTIIAKSAYLFSTNNASGVSEANKTFGSATAVQADNSTGVIQSPVDLMEHICRLQNWSETGDNQNWGKEYSPNALINKDSGANEGSFQYIGLNTVREISAARQILEYKKAWSDQLKKSLCKDFFLCNFQDTQGRENVVVVEKYDTTPSVSLTLADMVGKIGNVIEQNPEDVFVEPFVRFNKNYATGDFEGIIRVTNASASSFDASYVTGLTGGEAENVWDRCKALWQKYRQVEDPPSELTDKEWINTVEEAKRYLDRWLSWMGAINKEDTGVVVESHKYISFTVPYATGEAWHVGMHFDINLPHQTDASTFQGIIERLEFDLMGEVVKVRARLFSESTPIEFFIEDSTDSYATVGWEDWEDSELTKAEAPSQSYDIEKVT